MDIIKRAAIKSIRSGEALWFGCDVSKMYNSKLGVMDMNLYNYELLFLESYLIMIPFYFG